MDNYKEEQLENIKDIHNNIRKLLINAELIIRNLVNG